MLGNRNCYDMKNPHRHLYVSCLILLPALLSGGEVLAERIYKWVDENGEIQYGDRVPPRYATTERSVINDQGRTVKVYEAPKSPEEKAEAQALLKQQAEERKIAEQRAVRDHSLLSTYSSEEDMLMARDSKVASVETLIQLTKSRLDSMQKRLNELTDEAAEFERSGKKLPEGLVNQMKNIKEQIENNDDFLKNKQTEKEQIAIKFDEDIKRYRELTSGR
jgi:Holliday junction resolvase RusA-like endonuclease